MVTTHHRRFTLDKKSPTKKRTWKQWLLLLVAVDLLVGTAVATYYAGYAAGYAAGTQVVPGQQRAETVKALATDILKKQGAL